MKKFLSLLALIALCISVCSCSISSLSSQTQEYTIDKTPVKFYCPKSWWEDKQKTDYDIRCKSEDSELVLCVIAYRDIDLAEGVTRNDVYDTQIQYILDTRDNEKKIEDAVVSDSGDKTITTIIYSAEKDGKKYQYSMNLIEFDDSDYYLWVLLNGTPSTMEEEEETVLSIFDSFALEEE